MGALARAKVPGNSPGKQYGIRWRPRGDTLAAGSGDGTVMIWDAVTGRELHALKGHTASVRSVYWSPEGERLVSGAEDRTIRIWDTQSGRELLVLPCSANKFPAVAWSPTDRMISVALSTARIFDATIGYELAPTLTPAHSNR